MQLHPQKITPCLCFNDQAEAAVNYYLAIFPGARVLSLTRSGDGEPGGPKGAVRTILFQLFGQEFLAVNGGPHFSFNDSISLMINCASQAEIDALWEKLSAGGEVIQCGWLRDRFGVYWQVTPAMLGPLLSDPDPQKAQRVMQAVLHSSKLDIATLMRAYEGNV